MPRQKVSNQVDGFEGIASQGGVGRGKFAEEGSRVFENAVQGFGIRGSGFRGVGFRGSRFGIEGLGVQGFEDFGFGRL